MTQTISKTPLLILFIASIIPLMLASVNPRLWAFVNIIVFIFFSLWAYSITMGLVKKIEPEIKTSQFKVILISVTIYIILLSIYFALTFPDYEDPKWLLPIIILGQLFLAWSIFQTIFFISKTIATVDLKREVKFIDYVGYFVLIIFFPIGIWWLHPKIQSLLNR